MRIIVGLGVILLSCRGSFGQAKEAPLSFEVASIKPAAPQSLPGMMVAMRGGPGTPEPGQINFSNVSLMNILMRAYEVKGYQISGPKWLDTERFDIVAKVPAGTTREQFKLMLQNLLKERFGMVLHTESKELPMYALLVAKNGPKLKPSVDDPAAADTDGPPRPPGPARIGADGFPRLTAGGRGGMMIGFAPGGRRRMMARKQTLTQLADSLAGALGRPVVNLTELEGTYDFTLEYAAEPGQGLGPMPMPPPIPGGADTAGPVTGAPERQEGPSLITAVQEQLGLRLEARKGPVGILVIDRAEKVPTEN